MRNDIYSQTRLVTQKLIHAGIAIEYNFPKLNSNSLLWERYQNLSFIMKDEAYNTMYMALIRNKDYNFLMLDGAVVQMQYNFYKNKIESSILRYYPSPNNESFKEYEDLFEEAYYGNENFSDIVDKSSVSFPIRFDFDDDIKKFVEFDHSYSHCTMGNINNFRLPVCKPMSPYRFIDFILRNFYSKIFKEKFTNNSFNCTINIAETITISEKNLMHFNFT